MGRRSRRVRAEGAIAPKAIAPKRDLRSWLRLLGLGLLCAYVALVPLVFDTGTDAPFPVPKALLSHALAFAIGGLLLGLAALEGRRLWTWSWLHVPVLGFLGANVVAAAFAPDLFSALYGAHRRMLGLGTIADFVVVYFAAALLVRTRRQALALAGSALAGSVVILAYEFVQIAGRDPVDWNVNTAVRPFSTLGQTTTLAEYLTVLVIGAIAIALFDQAIPRWSRIALAVYSALLFAGVLVTQTRSALIGIVVGALALVLLTFVAHPSRRARVLALVGAGASALVIAFVLAFTPLGARILSTVEVPGIDVTSGDSGPRLEESANVRLGLYRIASMMVADRPLFGYGPDNFSVALPRYRSENEPAEVQQSLATSAHSWLAQAAATSGIIGLLFFIGIPAAGLVLTLKRRFQPGAWTGLAMQMAFLGAGLTTVSDVGVDWVFWLAAGGIAAATTQPGPSPAVATTARHPRQSKRSGWPGQAMVVASCVAAGIILALSSAGAYAASRSAKDSQLQRFGGHAQGAIDAGVRATQLDPRRPEYWDALGLAYISADRLGDAASAFRRTTALAPYNVAFFGDLASAYLLALQKGDASAGVPARQAVDQAVRVDPNNPQASLTRALVMQAIGDLKEAVVSVERALKLDQSNNPQILLTATKVYLADGRPDDAIAVARPAVSLLGKLPSSVPIRIELARALVATGQRAQALAELDAALAIRPNDPTALQLKAQIQQGQAQ